MKAFPNYLYNTVHIESLYNAEKQLFGIYYDRQCLTPNEYLQLHTHTFLDVISGIFYLCWVPVPLIFAAYLFFTKRENSLCTFHYISVCKHYWICWLLCVSRSSSLVCTTVWVSVYCSYSWQYCRLQRFDDFFHTRNFLMRCMPRVQMFLPLCLPYILPTR